MAEEAIQNLVEYCSANGITVPSSVQPRRVPGAGLGVYATEKISAGEKLVHVPTRHIFTTANIPESFLSKSARKNIAVHAQLAAFFAFGSENDLQQQKSWMATWPRLDDFVDGMPIFWEYWGECILEMLGKPTLVSQGDLQGLNGNHLPKRRKISNGFEHDHGPYLKRSWPDGTDSTFTVEPHFSLSPALCGMWHASQMLKGSLLYAMIDRLVAHIKSIADALPHLGLIGDDQQLAKFLQAWCSVNTRCFYYVLVSPPPSKKPKAKPKPPSDPNEAMALCPFMDLFNHRAPQLPQGPLGSQSDNGNTLLPNKVKRGSTGFTITAASAIPPDTEILLSYGAHTNDALWSEYGFLLPGVTNTSDSIPLDMIVSDSLKPLDRSALEEHGYLNKYTLHNDGSICYRTEMAAWVLVLGRAKWTKVVVQGLDPEEACTSPTGIATYQKTITSWLGKVGTYAMENTMVLNEMTDDLLVQYFGTISAIASIQQKSEDEKLALARRRRGMCLMRWAQISDMAERGMEKLKADNEREYI